MTKVKASILKKEVLKYMSLGGRAESTFTNKATELKLAEFLDSNLSKEDIDMVKKLPEQIVEDLNAVGLGGRLIYIPLRNRAKTISDEIYEAMVSRLKEEKSIDLYQFQNMVSMRTLYRLKAKAIEQFELLKEKGHGDAQTE
jgi:hypothetical protein